MRVLSSCRWLTVLCFCASVGCASSGTRNPLFAFRHSSQEEKEDASKAKLANPFASEDDVNKKNDDKAVAAKSATKPDEKSTTKASDPKSIADAKLLALIDEELPDMPPNEKYKTFVDLRGVDPVLAPRILRTLRRGWEMQNGKSVEVVQHETEPTVMSLDEDEPNDFDSDELPANAARNQLLPQNSKTRFPAKSGLGSVSPWDLDRPAASDNGSESSGHSFETSATQPTSNHSAAEESGLPVSPDRGKVAVATLPPSFPNRDVVQRTGHSLTSNPVQFDPSLPIETASHSANSLNLPAESRLAMRESFDEGNDIDTLRIQPNPDAFAPPKLAQSRPQRPTMTDGRNAVTFPTSDSSQMSLGHVAGDEREWLHDIEKLIAVTEAEVAQLKPGTTPEEREYYLSRHVHLRMLYLMAGQQERALQAVPYVDPNDQEFWQQMFWAIANYFDDQGMPDSSDRASQTITQLRSGMERLREKARLELRNVTFSHKITSFGSYERYDRDEFSPGQPVLVYAEVENFKSEPASDGQYRTILKSSVEIYRAGPNGELVHREEFPATEDLCRNHRRDYFHSYEVTIPQRISLGPHVLKLTVEDQLSRKIATYSLNFTVK